MISVREVMRGGQEVYDDLMSFGLVQQVDGDMHRMTQRGSEVLIALLICASRESKEDPTEGILLEMLADRLADRPSPG